MAAIPLPLAACRPLDLLRRILALKALRQTARIDLSPRSTPISTAIHKLSLGNTTGRPAGLDRSATAATLSWPLRPCMTVFRKCSIWGPALLAELVALMLLSFMGLSFQSNPVGSFYSDYPLMLAPPQLYPPIVPLVGINAYRAL